MVKEKGLFSNDDMTTSERYLHTPGSFARQNLLYVQEVGRLQSLQPHRCVRENLDSYLFVMVLEGKGSLNIKGKAYEIAQGSCAFIDCMEHYEHISDEREAWRLAWVHFNGHAARGYYDLFKEYNNCENVFAIDNVEKWDEMIGELMNSQKERNLLAELSSGEILLRLLNCIIEKVSNSGVLEKENEKQLANEIREKLNDQYADANIMQNLETVFREDVKELGEIFYRHFGISMEEYICNRRFNAAKELLRFSIKPIKTVALESGIGDIIMLQQMFRENEGMTAEEYRAKWAQWIR